MEYWSRTCLILCCYGFFKEMRPSDSFLTDYLIGPVQNLTEAEVIIICRCLEIHELLLLKCIIFNHPDTIKC